MKDLTEMKWCYKPKVKHEIMRVVDNSDDEIVNIVSEVMQTEMYGESGSL